MQTREMLWTETKTGADCESRHAAMWGLVVKQTDDGLVSKSRGEGLYEGGEFWSEGIARLKNDPLARLEMALRHLPLPAAFREASIALRAMIRSKRKAKLPYDEELRQLHRLGAMASLAPYDDLEMTPYTEVERIDLRPETIGWNEIVGTMDAKWMAEAWSEPKQHTTAKALYPEVAKASADRYAKARQKMRDNLHTHLDALFEQEERSGRQPSTLVAPITTPSIQSKPEKGFWARLFGL
jgi:hypothetical protein